MLDIERLYSSGFQGVIPDPEADERLRSRGFASADDALTAYGLAEVGSGKIALPFTHVIKCYGEAAMPGPAQLRGSCVAHCQKNAALVTLSTEAVSGVPDEETGKIEEAPEVPTSGISQGVLATEPVYWFRGHSSDGWYCPAAAEVMVDHTGAVVRKDYGKLDLTKYDPKTEGKYWQRSQIPDDVYDLFDDNKFRDAAECKTYEAIRDSLAVGLGVSSCGMEGFDGVRNEDGVMRRKGQWAHAIAVIGCVDTDEVKQKYGGPLLLFLNSWGRWGSGPRRIPGTDIDMPEGAFLARWQDVKERSYYAIAGLHGWARKALPDLNPGWL